MRCLFPSLLVAAAASAADTPLATRGQDTYGPQIQPLLEQFCYDCHSDGVRKGKFALDEHKDYTSLRADLKHWDHVRQMLVTHVMPPVGKKAPTLEQRDALVQWIDDNVFWFDPAKPDPGHVVMRRLNRDQYDNTIRDLLFLYDQRPSEEFPPDDTGYGYDNIGAVLSVSPLLMEKYFRAATKISAAAMKLKAPEKASIEIGATKFEKAKSIEFDGESQGVIWFLSEATAKAGFNVSAPGTYRLIVHASASQAGPDKARISIGVDEGKPEEREVHSEWADKNTKFEKIEIEQQLKPGYHKLKIAFLNDFYDEKAPQNHRDRNVAIDKVDVEGPIGMSSPQPSKFLQWLAPDLSFGLPGLALSGEDFSAGEGDAARDTGSILLASSGYVKHPLEIVKPGKYRFQIKAGAQQAGNDPAKYEVRLDDRVLQSGAVTAKDQVPQWFTFEADVQPGRHELRVAFTNDFYDPQTKADRNLWVHELKIEGPLDSKIDTLDANDVPALVARMGERLFRRPLNDAEKSKWASLAQQAIKDGEPALGSLGYVLEGMLTSPAFLFMSQPQPAGSRMGETELIDERSLASRLSYFLWNAPPDDQLMQLAAKGELRKNLASEMKRMIKDWRAKAFTDSFAGQWLQLRDVDLISPNPRQFPEFAGGIGSSMKRETEMLFNYILQENRSVIEFINADYTFVNRKLAQYYGLPGADKLNNKDKYHFEKVSLQGTPRGGILTQGSVLAITSNPTRTNIVRRGKFVLESILGIPPPPAPGNVTPLDEKKAIFGHQTLRQQFEQHRADLSCAGCHALLDPIGFALENYDAIGRYREQDHKQPIDSTGKWIRGQQFHNLQDLREIIVRDLKPDVVRCLAENLMTYSLGRGLGYSDRPFVKDVVKKSEATGYQFQDLILAVIESVPFQRMRVGGEAE
jgi:hypothetical protein